MLFHLCQVFSTVLMNNGIGFFFCFFFVGQLLHHKNMWNRRLDIIIILLVVDSITSLFSSKTLQMKTKQFRVFSTRFTLTNDFNCITATPDFQLPAFVKYFFNIYTEVSKLDTGGHWSTNTWTTKILTAKIPQRDLKV